MKITDVTTTLIHNPDSDVIQDATIPPPTPGARGRTTVFIHIHTDEGTQGFSYLNSPAAYPVVNQRQLQRHPHRQDSVRNRTHLDRDVLASARFW